MKSYTMNPFDYNKAWEKRFDIDVIIGTKILVDNEREYKIIKIVMPEDRENNSPHFTLAPIGENLKEHKREYDITAKKNPHLMKIGEYPDFSFEVESMWFFSRNVKIIERN